jgi:hypothetical protein
LVFPVGLFQEIVVCGRPVDNFPAGINGFCQAMAAVVAESKLPGDFQVLKDWRLPTPFTADEEAGQADLVDPKAVYPAADEAIRRATRQTRNRRWALLESFGESLFAR